MAAADPAPSEAQNYFAMLRQLPDALLLRLVVHWGCADATAERVAALLGCNLVRLDMCLLRSPLNIFLRGPEMMKFVMQITHANQAQWLNRLWCT